MKHVSGISRLALVSVTAVAALLTFGAVDASAETWLCVPTTAGKAVVSGGTAKEAKCEKETTAVWQPPAAQQTTLMNILPYIAFVASGVGGQPTIQFTGVNVQIINGAGNTYTTNSKGNLVIGYNESAGTQTGSHNLVVGGEQTFTSYGGFLAGYGNTVSARYASVTGGIGNTASAEDASVSGGNGNTAKTSRASVSGGADNTAEAKSASITGGQNNKATGEYSSVTGGKENTSAFNYSSIVGSKELTTKAEFEVLP